MSEQPAINWSLRPATEEDYALLYRLLEEALGPYVKAVWGWEEAHQRERFTREFRPSSWHVLILAGAEVGGIELEDRGVDLYLANLLIFPEHQGRALGTSVIRALLATAESARKPLRLQVLRVNPRAKALYERLGFIVEDESDEYFSLKSPANVSMPAGPTVDRDHPGSSTAKQ